MSGTQSSQGAQNFLGSFSVTQSTPTLVHFIPTSTNSQYSPVVAALLGDSTYSSVQGSGGWQVVDRPKSIAATQWYDRSPFQLVMTLLIDDQFTGNQCEAMCQQLESWLDADPSKGTLLEPTTFIMTGPLPGLTTPQGAREWFFYSLEFDEAIRSSPNNRTQQNLQVTCYEYNTPIPGGSSYSAVTSPAVKAASALAQQNNYTYIGTQSATGA